ncbi:hypothetical protein GCQ56_07715 [Marinifilum sp. N1E240]|uniref:HK97 gp10 family phage protein n=1 Tax=Marinifilum sp. N1E240 TaxID=2608082 RepID=UPI00128DFB85|nr:HK97 gp10 family phage protein [Marinifilum sp. N1E240]MPQ46900.1 hypothetical protein [Marinifilum sp. N1E240]
MGVILSGVKILDEIYNEFTTSEQKGIDLKVFKKVAKPLIKEIRNNLKPNKKTGNLAKSIGTKNIKGKKGLRIGARVFGNWRGYHGHLLENGTGNRGKYGTMKGTNYFSGAITTTANVSEDIMVKEYAEIITSIIQKAKKQ